MTTKAQNYEQWPVPTSPIVEMTCSAQHTYFSLWSPKADAVRVRLYSSDNAPKPTRELTLTRRTQGLWSATLQEDLRGWFYTFQVQYQGQWLAESPGIFARAVGVNGQRAQVLDLRQTDPEGWHDDGRPAFRSTDEAVVYEMHHRDFSIDEESGVRHKGKFLALTENGTHVPGEAGVATGISHLQELGVTHVHLLPSYDYGSVDEHRLSTPQYNWGYDPVNYNVPEGSYSMNPADPSVRIREMKQMVQALHRAGIRVVMDVVYNHVFDLGSSPFQRTAPGYFFRCYADGTAANGSGCGNETASERPMMRKFMVESVLYWAREYHIDGFRFDLMGIHDLETMQAIREALDAYDPSIIMYGEGWAAASPQLPADRLAMKANMAQLPGVAAFGDELRDGLRGPWDGDEKGAFLVGIPGHEESVRFGIAGAIAHDQVDVSKVNYSKLLINYFLN
ncbi:MAG: type I pullulanase [Bacteroidaceae bacterium]|nr:type I pullulanase [Bacteroidaceae bacterium]